MRTAISIVTTLTLVFGSVTVAFAQAPIAAHPVAEPFAEYPLVPIPAGMTYEEYEDMNRGMLKAMPYGILPGGIHFYSQEDTTGWVLVGTVATGIALVIVGAGMHETTDDFQESDYETIDIGDKRFARVPTHMENAPSGATTHYRLEEVEREPKAGAAGALVGLGAAAILGSYLYDWFHGMRVIEEKRNRVRYKYGTQLKTGLAIDPVTGEPRVTMDLRF